MSKYRIARSDDGFWVVIKGKRLIGMRHTRKSARELIATDRAADEQRRQDIIGKQDAVRTEVLQRWDAGENWVDIARSLGLELWRTRRLIELARMYDVRDQGPPPAPGLSNEARRKANRHRNGKLIRRRAAGWSWRKLATEFRVSPERCRQIYARHLQESAT
jgi:hypothetical protein